MKQLNRLKYKNWTLISAPDVGVEDAKELFHTVQDSKFETCEVLKDNQRSEVKRIKVSDNDFVLKIPKEKNSRFWIRFLTLFRKGEAQKNLKSMMILKNIGVKTTNPILAAEKRSFGMVVDSWLLYQFVDGRSCLNQPETYKKVIDTLESIHQYGFIHGDPQIRNFIQKDSDIYVIDANPQKAGMTGFDFGYEWAYLRKSDKGIQPILDDLIDSKWYKFAIWYDKVDRKLARLRKRVKKVFGVKSS
ncbi:lipopolysaccharide core heptose(II) kinase RfaY [Fulvivirga lutea]|uniref:Protein kinase domain-containing protein n=1 Tax=Fulvivirga lutea TaxID=2810512 RepID=A0A974WIL2_9BACT|nr:lipopolysaccharide core heptose(II) kinase RfaY [Fulvivirga lutea]QSE97817.1 hypothetical protein JR347_01635 [Fulvivirga lutea]